MSINDNDNILRLVDLKKHFIPHQTLLKSLVGKPTRPRYSRISSSACFLSILRCSWRVSSICLPMVYTGVRQFMAPWKTMEICSQRTFLRT